MDKKILLSESGFDLVPSASESSILFEENEGPILVLEDNDLCSNRLVGSSECVIESQKNIPHAHTHVQSQSPTQTQGRTGTDTEIQQDVNWRKEAINGNFMPAVVKLDRKEINVNEIVDTNSDNRLIHLAVLHSYLNVTRCLVEIFECDINSKNILDQTPLHLICNNSYQDLYVLALFLKNDLTQLNVADKTGLSPMIYSVINKFNLALMALAHLKVDFSHVDNLHGNNALYFALTCDNKFAVKFFLKHISDLDINQLYYRKQATLADILITTKNTSSTKHLVRYHHNEISMNSILACKKRIDQFPVYNKFNYDLINTLYFYKSKDFINFIKAVTKGDYTYRMYNLWFMIYDLLIQNTNKIVKLSVIWIYVIAICFLFYHLFSIVSGARSEAEGAPGSGYLSFQTVFNLWQLSSIFTLLISMIKFTFYRYKTDFYEENQYTLNNPHYASEYVCYQIYQAMERNPVDLFFEEEICEICLIRHDKNTIHCNICGKCVKDFYFHSKLFSVCFSRKNINYYILFLSSLCALHFSIFYFLYFIVDIETVGINAYRNKHSIYTSQSLLTNIVLLFINASLMRIVFIIGFFVACVIYLQKTLGLVLCVGYKTTYYNAYRHHKRSIGVIQPRMNLYYNIPDMNLISLCDFFKNLIFGG